MGDVVEVIVEQLIVRVGIDETDFHKDSGHFCSFQDDEVRAGFHAEIDKADTFQLVVDVLRHFQFDTGQAVYKRFHTGNSIVGRK